MAGFLVQGGGPGRGMMRPNAGAGNRAQASQPKKSS